MGPPASETDIVKSLVDRIEALEARVALLEGGAKVAPDADPCPTCGGRLKLTDEVDHPTFGMMGVKVRTFACETCGRAVTRDWKPPKG